ncbi:hypothetical protein I2494_19980 [Budviciaceae bacterium BWR-B9]|uniref:Phage protein n=2 Tax=Budviciaceae TaxID=1903416 RepID=A0ABS1IWQ6_9GAMM|nr:MULTISPECIES: hypothetical protein [Limnobaculum]MBK5145951.1 hypothetical protein [Limnobaculum allomyrinae]MBV7693994.1 hypothetical protein [Limnobaculum sp. M2-1]
MMDYQRHRREAMRWNILQMLYKSRPYTTNEQFVLNVIGTIYPDVTALELRQELDYLSDRKMLELTRQPSGTWFADLTRLGVDLVEYTVECGPGIARPVKYWSE